MHAMQMYCDNRREPKVGMLCEGVLMGCWGVCNRNQHLWPIDEVVMGGNGVFRNIVMRTSITSKLFLLGCFTSLEVK